jgi:hypothetical protein
MRAYEVVAARWHAGEWRVRILVRNVTTAGRGRILGEVRALEGQAPLVKLVWDFRRKSGDTRICCCTSTAIRRAPTTREESTDRLQGDASGSTRRFAVPLLRASRGHPDNAVRRGVVSGLLGLMDDLAVATLIELSRDQEADIRDWATFGFGSQLDRDDPSIREALIARLDDPDDNTREEALVGLAARGDERAVPRLLFELERLEQSEDPARVEQALLLLAGKTGDAGLCRHVERFRIDWEAKCPDEPVPDDLRAAVERCLRT